MMATNDTVVENSDAAGIRNACWDHWEGASNGVVRGGYCETANVGSGLFVTGGTLELLRQIVGRGRAAELLLTGRTVGADEALAIGLVTDVSKHRDREE